MRFLLLLILTVFLAQPAFAQPREVMACGKALETDMNKRPAYNYCDIYSRQIAYGANNADFREQVDTRRDDYNVPREQALKAYNEWLDARFEKPAEPVEEVAPEAAQKSTDDLNEEQLSKMLGGELK